MESRKIKILYVDEEMADLLGFKASFSINYDIFIACNRVEALDILEKHADIHLIFIGQQMPDRAGVELLETIRNVYPMPVRMLIGGYTDVDPVVDAINRGHIFRYIKNPWSEKDIISAIDEAYRYYVSTSLLALQNTELKNAYHELDNFANSVAHDLRGPMMSISGAIELLKNETDIEAIHRMHFLMNRCVIKLDGFIVSMHNFYRIRRGNIQVEKIDFNELLDDLKSVYAMMEDTEDVKLITHLEETSEFRSDLISITMILDNLLSNSFKYQRKNNPDKWVDLNIKVEKGKATMIVKDNGSGIAEEYVDRIFNMFFRATEDETGSGFGLYNVKEVLKKIGGEIKVKSIVGEGSEFEVSIPSKE